MKGLYEYIIETFDYGRQLFGDFNPINGDSYGTDNYHMRFLEKNIKKYYKKHEPNTEEEQRILKAICDRVSRYNQKPSVKFDEFMFTELLELKDEFPNILDPSLNDNDLVYRGAFMDTKLFREIINHNNPDHLKNIQVPLRSKDRYSTIHSFSLSKGSAEYFSKSTKNPNKLVNIIICARYGDVKNNCLFNPNFIADINPKYEDEKEILYMGSTIQPIKILWDTHDMDYWQRIWKSNV